MSKAVHFFRKHVLLTSSGITLFVFLLFLLLNSFRFVNGSYEEYAFSMLLSGGDDVILFLGVFLSKALVALQNIIPFVNVFSVFLILSGLMSFTVLNYIFLKHFSLKLGALLSLVFDALWMNVVVISFQWTHTATMICLASASLIFFMCLYEKRKGVKILQIFFGICGVILSTQLRVNAAEVCLVFGCLFAFCVLIRNVFDNKAQTFKSKFFSGLKKSLSVLLAALLMLVGCFACDVVSEKIKCTDEAYSGYVEYNNIRSLTEDYPIAEYEVNKSFYESVGIYSKGDFDLLTCFKLDKDFFTVERLESIYKYAQEHDSGIQNIYLAYFRALKNKVGGFLGNDVWVYPLLGVAGLAALGTLYLLYRFRNRIKILFLVLFSVMWGIFLMLLGPGVLLKNVLLLVFFVLSMIIVLIGNRYQFAFSVVFNISILLLYNYMAHMRLGFRVAITFLIPGIFFLLMLFDTRDIRISIVSKYRKIPKWAGGVAWCVLPICLVLVVQTQIGVFFFNTKDSRYDSELVKYINSNKNSVYFFDWYGCELLDHTKYNPLVIPDYPDNSVHYSSWPISSHLFESQLQENGIRHLHQDMINSDRYKFVISKEDSVYIQQLEDYYNTHYRTNYDIELKEVYETENAWIYRVIEKK